MSCPTVRVRHPDAYVFGEVIHGDYAGFVRENRASIRSRNMNYGRRSGGALNDRNCFEARLGDGSGK